MVDLESAGDELYAGSPDDFIEHYHDTHAVMGRTWVKGVAGYVVSLADISQEPLAAVRSGTCLSWPICQTASNAAAIFCSSLMRISSSGQWTTLRF